MTDALTRLARAAGLAVEWTDAAGRARTVGADTLRAVLAALELPADNDRSARDSLARLKQMRDKRPPLRVGVVSGLLPVVAKGAIVRLVADNGEHHDCPMTNEKIRLPEIPGYYRSADSGERFAVAPRQAWLPDGAAWGIGVQLYGLRGGTSAGFGDFAALASFCEQAGAAGANAVAISPVHALFGAAPSRISPYAPSTRLWLNPLYAALSRKMRDVNTKLVDWPVAAPRKIAALRREFAHFRQDDDFTAFLRKGGKRLLAHARFEVLDERFRAHGCNSWQDWPADFRDPDSSSVHALAPADPDVAFQLFLQWRADVSLAVAQAKARHAGMGVGLITDMAVGMDPAGSHAWSAPQEVLRELTVGAPPDAFNSKGQNWGLTNLSPHGLTQSGYDGFIATLRAAMRHAGGIRLDHAMGLERLWIIPKGAHATDGVYLQYPLRPLLNLIALESWQHRVLVVAEDLGTVPPGLRARLARARLLGMRVLWFERDVKGRFLPPQSWDAKAAALSTTHDLPTLAGWWSGTDLAWRRKLGQQPSPAKMERQRARERAALWRMLVQAGCAGGPRPTDPQAFADAAFAAIAATPSALKLLPIEDFLGQKEQPNIPGTVDEHPNWRRRLGTAKPLATAKARRRAAILKSRT